jgi:hypothetical protein
VIDKEEFKKIMALMRFINRQGAPIVMACVSDLKLATLWKMVVWSSISLVMMGMNLYTDKFSKFLKELHEEVICFLHSLVNLKTCPQLGP